MELACPLFTLLYVYVWKGKTNHGVYVEHFLSSLLPSPNKANIWPSATAPSVAPGVPTDVFSRVKGRWSNKYNLVQGDGRDE